MSKAWPYWSFFLVILSTWLLSVESVEGLNSEDVVVGWKTYPPKCWTAYPQYRVHNVRNATECQEICGSERQCRKAFLWKTTTCYLSNALLHRELPHACRTKIIVIEKVYAEKLQNATEQSTLKSKASDNPLFKYRGMCPDVPYSHKYKTGQEFICKQACDENRECTFAVYNSEHSSCHLASAASYLKRCADSNFVYIRDSASIVHRGKCLIMTHEHDLTEYKYQMSESKCQLACEEKSWCKMAIYNGEKHTCLSSSNTKALAPTAWQNCPLENVVFEKVNRTKLMSLLENSGSDHFSSQAILGLSGTAVILSTFF